MDNTTAFVAWVALITSIVALLLGWMAFNRSGVDVEALVQREVTEATAEIDQRYEALEERVRSSTSDTLRDAARDVETDDR